MGISAFVNQVTGAVVLADDHEMGHSEEKSVFYDPGKALSQRSVARASSIPSGKRASMT